MKKVSKFVNTPNGIIMYYTLVDWEGNEVTRTPSKYPYSYDPYVLVKHKDKYDNCVYSDRLYQFDSEKHNTLCQKHFGNMGQYWDSRSEDKIESFLKDYYDNPKLKLVGIMTGCNQSSGYPYWIFMFDN